MIDITLENYKTELVDASLQQPVLLDIWAPWCGPCKALGPMLEKLEQEYAGRFVLAKLNSDDVPELSQQLSQMLGVRSIPFCVMFVDGRPIDGFVGAIPETQIKAFLDKHVPAAEELAAQADLSEAEALLERGDTQSALEKLQEAVAINPANHEARFDLVKLLLEQGQLASAQTYYAPVAASSQQPGGDARLAALGHWLGACQAAPNSRDDATLKAAIDGNKRDFEARFERVQKFLAQAHFEPALEELLEIIMRDRKWQDEIARRTYVAILELMTPAKPKNAATQSQAGVIEVKGASAAQDPRQELVASYRRKLSMALN